MSILNQGRNEIPVNNSDAKCLLENWVEERAVRYIDPVCKLEDGITSTAQVLRHGHQGLITTDFDAKPLGKSVTHWVYTPPEKNKVRLVGSKKEMLEKRLYEQVCKEYKVDMPSDPEPTDFRSVQMVDYTREFVPITHPATRDHNYRTEQPVTFWSEHRDKIHGVSAVKTRDTAFRKNDAFSKPIGEYWNEPKPYELEDYPKM